MYIYIHDMYRAYKYNPTSFPREWNSQSHTFSIVARVGSVRKTSMADEIWEEYVCHNESCHTREWVMSHTLTRHVARIGYMQDSKADEIWEEHVCHNESCHTRECVMSHTWTNHVARIGYMRATSIADDIWKAFLAQWVTSHMWMSHGTHVNEACRPRWTRTRDWHGRCDLREVSHVTRANVSCHTYEWIMSCHTCRKVMSSALDVCQGLRGRWSLEYMCHNESCHTCECVMSVNESCHTYEWVMSRKWMSQVKHVNEACRPRQVRARNCEANGVWEENVCHNESYHTREWVWMSHVTRVNLSCQTCEWVMSNVWMSQTHTHTHTYTHTYTHEQTHRRRGSAQLVAALHQSS